MSFVVFDDSVNEALAVLSDISMAQFIQKLYDDIGIKSVIRTHDAVSCVTVDDDLKPMYVFEI